MRYPTLKMVIKKEDAYLNRFLRCLNVCRSMYVCMCHKFAASDNNVAIIIIKLAIAQGALPEIIIQKLKYTVNSGTNRSLCKFMYPFIIIYF